MLTGKACVYRWRTNRYVDKFTFLGSVVPGTREDIRRRLALASSAFGKLRNTVWNRRDIPRKLKVRIYKCLILPIAIYASETWTLRKEDARRLEVFEMRCLRALMGVTRRDRLRNEYIREQIGVMESIVEVVKRKRLKWFGHVMRRPPDSLVKAAYSGDFTAARPRGRPPMRWRDQIPTDTGRSLRECERLAEEREDWRQISGVRSRARGRYHLPP